MGPTDRGFVITPLQNETSGSSAGAAVVSESSASSLGSPKLKPIDSPVDEPDSPVPDLVKTPEKEGVSQDADSLKVWMKREGSSASLRLDTILRQQFEDDGNGTSEDGRSPSSLELSKSVWQSFASETSLRTCMIRLVDNKVFQSFFLFLTLYALFASDIAVMVGDKTSSDVISIVSTLVFGLFGLEVVFNSLAKRTYAFRSSIFWLDLVAMLSILPDTILLKEFVAGNALMAGRSSRLTRIIRIASRSLKATRLNRMTRLVRVAAVLPRFAASFRESGISNKEQEVGLLLDRKLRRIFTYVDDDRDGAISMEELNLVLARIKLQNQRPKSIISSRLGSSFLPNVKLKRPPVSNSPELTPRPTPKEPPSPRRVSFSLELEEDPAPEAVTSQDDEQDQERAVGATPSSRTTTSSASSVSSIGFESEGSEGGISFNEFKKLVLSEEKVRARLYKSCETQIQRTANMQSLGIMHVEDVGVKVAFNVIFLLLVLSLLVPLSRDTSQKLALEHLDTQAQRQFSSWSSDSLPIELQEQVMLWQAHLMSTEPWSQLLYLDINSRVVCNSLDKSSSCLQFSSGSHVEQGWPWPNRISLENFNWQVAESSHRLEDMELIQLPPDNELNDGLSPEEIDEKVTAVAIRDIRAQREVQALESLLTTLSVMFIILVGIGTLTKDLGGFSKNLLKPIRSLADEMQSIATMQLAALNQDDQKSLYTGVAEVRLIQNIFEKTKTAIRSWGKYVPWPVVQQLLAAGIDAEQGVSDKEVTMFFSDIASFTTIVEKLPPEKSLILLSRYFNDMSSVIDSQQGIVIEFIGDAILSVFGAPLKNRDHAEAAIKATLKMLKALDRINSWALNRGLPKVSIRCGVHTGEVLVGNMGFHSRMKYGIVGEHANMPSMLEELNKTYGTNNLISQATFRRLPRNVYLSRVVDHIYLRKQSGASSCEPVYQILGRVARDGAKHRIEDMLMRYDAALQSYMKRNFELAVKQFDKACKKTKTELGLEDKAALLMKNRSMAYLKNPPPATWDGVWDGPDPEES